MFNRTILVTPKVTENRYVTVTEQRAATDDSVKLLREMESKAEAQVIEAVRVGDTHFECVVQRQVNMMSDTTLVRAVFSLNGKKMHETWEAPGRPTLREAFDGIKKLVAERIAAEVLLPAFSAFPKTYT